MKFEVQAPIDLECGYPLEVDIDGNTVTVAVPYNVKAVEVDDFQPKEAPPRLSETDTHNNTGISMAPIGRWRYGLCDCCNLCCVSGLWWNAFCFTFIVWGQLLTRLKLDPFANPGSPGCAKKSCYIFVSFVISALLILVLLLNGNPLAIFTPLLVIFISLDVYLLVVLTRLRGQYRRQYRIPGSCCDDCCCIACCGICNTIQMARHTHDEHIYKYQCCNTTGLPPDAHQIV